MTGEAGLDKRGLWIDDKTAVNPWTLRVGDVSQEMMYGACETGNDDFFRDVKEQGPIFGFFFSKSF